MEKTTFGKLFFLSAGIIGLLSGVRLLTKQNRKIMSEEAQIALLTQWLKLNREGRSILRYLNEKGYKRIAIYGINRLGENVLAELKDSGIEVIYGIDKCAADIFCEIDIYSLQEKLPEADAVIVCETSCFGDIVSLLKEKIDCPVVNLEEVIYES